MKKFNIRHKVRLFSAMLVAMAILFSFSSCAKETSSGGQDSSKDADRPMASVSIPDEKTSSPLTTDSSKITMTTQYPEYSTDSKEITIIMSNHGDGEYLYEAYAFQLQKQVNGQWQDVPFLSGGDNFPALAGILEPNKSIESTIKLTTYFALPLEPGDYRIKKDLLTAAFKIV